jgi:hypothetical protein
MRLRPLALAAVAALILLAGCKNSDLPPSPSALINGTRDRVNPFRMTLTTDPTWPKASGPTLIKVHIIDGSNQPVEGVELKADISMPGMAQHTSFDDRGKGDYETQVTLEMAGNWDVDLNASKDGRTKQQRLNIEVGN